MIANIYLKDNITNGRAMDRLGVKSNKEIFIIVAILIIPIIRIAFSIGDYLYFEYFCGDFVLRWREGAYVLLGINPFHIIHTPAESIDIIGTLPEYSGTVPWAFLLGNVFTFSFLPFGIARILQMLMHGVVGLLTVVSAYKHLENNTKEASNTLRLAVILAAVTLNGYLFGAFKWGNYGGLCSMVLVMAVVMLDKKPYLAGVLIGIASIKPQLAFLFYITLLIEKRFKTFFVASVIPLVSWIMASVLTKTSPIKFLLQMQTQAEVGYGEQQYGLFDFLAQGGGIDNNQALLLSAAVGIIATIVGGFIMKKYKAPPIYAYSFTALISLFWFYKQPHDYPIIMLIMLAFLHLISDKKLTRLGRWVSGTIVVIYTVISNTYPPVITEGIGAIFESLGAAETYKTLEKMATSPYFLYIFCIVWFFIIVVIMDVKEKNTRLKKSLVE